MFALPPLPLEGGGRHGRRALFAAVFLLCTNIRRGRSNEVARMQMACWCDLLDINSWRCRLSALVQLLSGLGCSGARNDRATVCGFPHTALRSGDGSVGTIDNSG